MTRIIRLTTIAAALLLLSGCASRPLLEEKPLTQPLPTIDKPDWSVGYRQFSLDNQTGEENSWEIISIDNNDRVTARSSNGCEWTVPGEWFAGVERWENCGGSNGSRKLLKSEGSLWPLKVGNRSSYSYQMELDNQNDSQYERVSCEVVSEGMVSVALGDMGVYRVECARTNEWSTETRTWYWSPEAGEVKFIRYDNKKGIRRDVDVLRSEKG